jgi:hypothetical protein
MSRLLVLQPRGKKKEKVKGVSWGIEIKETVDEKKPRPIIKHLSSNRPSQDSSLC